MFDSDGTDMVNGYTSSIIVDYGASVDGYVTVAGSCDFTLGDDPWDQSAAQAAAAQTADYYEVLTGQYFALTGTSSGGQMCMVSFDTEEPSDSVSAAAAVALGRALTLAAVSVSALLLST